MWVSLWCAWGALAVSAAASQPAAPAPPQRVALAGVALRGDVAPAEATRLARALHDNLWARQALVPMMAEGAPENLWTNLAAAEAAARAARAALEEEIDYDLCAARMQEARTLYDKGPAFVAHSPVMADGLLVLAQCLEGKGDSKGQRAALQERASRWPDLEVDPNVFPPPVVEALGKVRTQLQAAPATLDIQSDPPGARVWVDGVDRGTSPASVAVLEGKHHVFMLDPSGAAAALVVNAARNKTARARAALPVERWATTWTMVTDAVRNPAQKDLAGVVKTIPGAEALDLVVVGLLLSQGPGKPARALLLGFKADTGVLVRATTTLWSPGSDGDAVVKAALDALWADPGPNALDEASALLEGRPYTAPKAAGATKKSGGGPPRWVLPVVLVGAVAVVLVVVAVVVFAASGLTMGGFFLLNSPAVGGSGGPGAGLPAPPGTSSGTQVNVDGRNL